MPNQYSVEDLSNNLNYLSETKGLIKNAIIDKGQNVSDEDTFRSYANKIENISGGVSPLGPNSNLYHFDSMDDMKEYLITDIGEKAFVYNNTTENFGGLFESIKTDELHSYKGYNIVSLSNTSPYGDFSELQEGLTIDTLNLIREKLVTYLEGTDNVNDDSWYLVEKISESQYAVYRFIFSITFPMSFVGVTVDIPLVSYNADFILTDYKNTISGETSEPDINFVLDLRNAIDNIDDSTFPIPISSLVIERYLIPALKYAMQSYSGEEFTMYRYIVDINNDEVSEETYHSLDYTGNDIKYYCKDFNFANRDLYLAFLSPDYRTFNKNCKSLYKYNDSYGTSTLFLIGKTFYTKFLPAKTEFTADSSQVVDGWFYGSEGVDQGDMFSYMRYSQPNKVRNRANTFYEIENMKKIDTSSLTDTSKYFYNCRNLVIAPNFDTSNVTNMSSMFNDCINLELVPNYNTSNVTDMHSMFCFYSFLPAQRRGCSIYTVPKFNTLNVVNMSDMFRHCINLSVVPNFYTINVESVANMFQNCTNLIEVPNFMFNKVTNMIAFLDDCPNITMIPCWNTINATSMYILCENCYNLVDVPQLKTGNVTDLRNSFRKCNNLSNASIQNIVNMCLNSNVTNTTYMNLNNTNQYSPFYESKIDSTYYSNRLSDIVNAGWSY